jgi:hypothetical protein
MKKFQPCAFQIEDSADFLRVSFQLEEQTTRFCDIKYDANRWGFEKYTQQEAKDIIKGILLQGKNREKLLKDYFDAELLNCAVEKIMNRIERKFIHKVFLKKKKKKKTIYSYRRISRLEMSNDDVYSISFDELPTLGVDERGDFWYDDLIPTKNEAMELSGNLVVIGYGRHAGRRFWQLPQLVKNKIRLQVKKQEVSKEYIGS